MEQLANAMVSSDHDAIRALLHRDVILTIDSGGLLPLTSTPLEGPSAAASALRALMRVGTSITMASINSAPGFTLVRDEAVVGAVTAEMRAGRLSSIWVVCNPEKLRHWNPR
jgi:RNA polymerase sigma-70 factor (ECF subfamily)